MPRTPEQIEADDNLAAAITAAHRAWHGEVDGVMTKYIVITNRQCWHEDGDQYTVSYIHVSDGYIPLSDQLGLVEFAATRLRRNINED